MSIFANWLQNVDYPARVDRVLYDNLWTQGIIGSTSLAVTQRPTPAMAVDVATGVGVVAGTDQAFQGKYLCRAEAIIDNVTIAAAPGSGARNDIVVMQVRDPNAGGASGDDARIFVVQGVASGSPVDPTIPASSLPLARVRVASGTGSITNSMIDDLRVETRVVGATPPSGSIMAYAGSTAPTGWLLCDGTPYSQSAYSALFSVIGGNYNTSAGQVAPAVGMFRVPTLVGRMPVGRDAGQTEFDVLGEAGGAKTHTLTSAEMPSHTHTQDSHNHTQNAHNHTQDGHNHTQNSHNHTQDSHSHSTVDAGSHSHGAATGTTGNHQHSGTVNQTSATSHTHVTNGTFASGLTGSGGSSSAFVNFTGDHSHTIGADGTHGHTINGATATNQANTASNNATTATNQAATATNNGATAVNQPTGGGAAHPILQPYLVLNYIIKA